MYSTSIKAIQVHSLKGHKASIFSLARLEEENRFLSGDGNGYVVEWNLEEPENGTAVAQLPSNVFCMKYIADRNILAVGTMSGVLYFLDYKTKALIKAIEYHKGGIFHLWRSDNILYACGGDGQLSLWDLEELNLSHSVQVSDKSLRCLDFSLEKSMLAIGSSDHNIHLYSFSELEKIGILSGHTNSVFSLKFSADGHRIYSGSRDAQLKLWDVEEKSELNSLAAHMRTVNSLAFHPGYPDIPLLATASRDKSIKIWDPEEEKLLKVISIEKQPSHTHSVNKLLWTGHENILISAGDDRALLAWKIVSEPILD